VPKIPNSVIKRYKDITRSYGKNDKKSGLASKISHRKQPVKNNREPYVLSDDTRLCSPYLCSNVLIANNIEQIGRR
jgi:hypothetical protein